MSFSCNINLFKPEEPCGIWARFAITLVLCVKLDHWEIQRCQAEVTFGMVEEAVLSIPVFYSIFLVFKLLSNQYMIACLLYFTSISIHFDFTLVGADHSGKFSRITSFMWRKLFPFFFLWSPIKLLVGLPVAGYSRRSMWVVRIHRLSFQI